MSLRIFIQLMWKEYKPQIIKWKLVPYLIYTIVMNITTLLGAEFLDNI